MLVMGMGTFKWNYDLKFPKHQEIRACSMSLWPIPLSIQTLHFYGFFWGYIVTYCPGQQFSAFIANEKREKKRKQKGGGRERNGVLQRQK